MAATPAKSQPLHNFSLPSLKWAHKTLASAGASNSHPQRFRRRDSPDRNHTDHGTDAEAKPKKQSQPAALDGGLEEENGEAKPWNLRPRKEIMKPAKKEVTVGDNKGNCGVKSQRLRGGGGGGGGKHYGGVDRKGESRVWISLSREEIEEDVYSLTGGRPARRPKKWPKHVQKQLDSVFPGLYLAGVAAESYRVTML